MSDGVVRDSYMYGLARLTSIGINCRNPDSLFEYLQFCHRILSYHPLLKKETKPLKLKWIDVFRSDLQL